MIHPLVYLIPAFATVAYVYDSFLLGQINVVLLGEAGPTVEARPAAEVRAALDTLIAG